MIEQKKSTAYCRRPLKILPTRVRRTYRGGKNLDLWHGASEGMDGDRPEEWLASVTEAVNPGFPPVEQEGLSKVDVNGAHDLLKNLIEEMPKAMLGEKHYRTYGIKTGVLTKILDPAERLSIQVHPDKSFARKYFHSDYGKTECWHILSTREIDGKPPVLLMGFRPGVTRADWEALFRKQDIQGMVDCLNRIEAKPGETYLVPGGLVHAIGPGLCMIEIQEPTDYTMRAERTDAAGKKIPDALIHQGLGEELLMECFHYEGMTEKEIRKRYQIPAKEIRYQNGSHCSLLIGPEKTDVFSMEKAEVAGKLVFKNPGSFTILVVLSGKGKLSWDGGSEEIGSGDQFFIPASAGDVAIDAQEEKCMVVRCYPPQAEPTAAIE